MKGYMCSSISEGMSTIFKRWKYYIYANKHNLVKKKNSRRMVLSILFSFIYFIHLQVADGCGLPKRKIQIVLGMFSITKGPN